jgi:predicted nucleotidyltransferase
MNVQMSYPGTERHQALLHQIVAYYRDDPRVLALVLFGSLPRGTWDHHSDLDLDVVIRDDVQLEPVSEVQRLCAALAEIGESALLVVPNNADAADVVLASLREFSIRYHSLATTSPNIIDSACVLCGPLSLEQIKAAGATNRGSTAESAAFDRFVRLALAVDRELQRQRFWHALPLLEQMRTIVVEAFADKHGGVRPYSVWQADASPALHTLLGATLPQPTLASLQRSLLRLLDLVEQQPIEFGLAGGLSSAQQTILQGIRARQSHVQFDEPHLDQSAGRN